MFRTDMAVEFSPTNTVKHIDNTLKRTDVAINTDKAKALGRAKGNYITLESSVVLGGDRFMYGRLSGELSQAIIESGITNNVLIVGLGNPDMTADALGKNTTDNIIVTRHLKQKNMARVSAVCPNVLGMTGIESYDIVKGVVDRINPTCVVAVDSLAGATTGRIASAFQVSNAGITPGSGISNHRKRLDKNSLGIPVISVGVPLVVYASTIINDAVNGKADINYDSQFNSLVVTPKDIDVYVKDCGKIIADALNTAIFGDKLSELL